jgi:hypothetical protein
MSDNYDNDGFDAESP